MNTKYLGYILLIGFIGVVLFFTKKSGNDYKIIREKGDIDTCTVETFGGDVICHFEINGEKLSKRLSKPHESIRDGEKYIVYYYHEIPDKYYVSFKEPIIDENEFASIEANSVELKGEHLLFFYTVEGKTYKRYQDAVKGVDIDTKSSYVVRYKRKSPQIAYIIY